MNKSTAITVALDEEAYVVFQNASEIVSKAGIHVPRANWSRQCSTPRCLGFRPARSPSGFSNRSWNRSAHSPVRNSMRKMTPFQAFPYRKPNEYSSTE
jgi:hypothetical protein